MIPHLGRVIRLGIGRPHGEPPPESLVVQPLCPGRFASIDRRLIGLFDMNLSTRQDRSVAGLDPVGLHFAVDVGPHRVLPIAECRNGANHHQQDHRQHHRVFDTRHAVFFAHKAQE